MPPLLSAPPSRSAHRFTIRYRLPLSLVWAGGPFRLPEQERENRPLREERGGESLWLHAHSGLSLAGVPLPEEKNPLQRKRGWETGSCPWPLLTFAASFSPSEKRGSKPLHRKREQRKELPATVRDFLFASFSFQKEKEVRPCF